MANMKECSGSGRHMFDTDQHSTCPVCGAPPVTGMNNISNKKSKLPWIIAIIAILIAAATASFMQKAQEQVKVQTEKYNELNKNYNSYRNKYADFEKTFGFGSNDYRASLPVVVLDAGGSSKEFYIYAIEKYHEKAWLKESNGDRFSADWNGKWNDNWKKVIVAPKNYRGFYTIRFWNKLDTTAFNVLVIVK